MPIQYAPLHIIYYFLKIGQGTKVTKFWLLVSLHLPQYMKVVYYFVIKDIWKQQWIIGCITVVVYQYLNVLRHLKHFYVARTNKIWLDFQYLTNTVTNTNDGKQLVETSLNNLSLFNPIMYARKWSFLQNYKCIIFNYLLVILIVYSLFLNY